MFKELNSVPLDALELDPTNPRFAEDFSSEDTPKSQQAIIDHFLGKESDDGSSEDETETGGKYGLDNLITSIRTIGFVPIDKPVVKRIPSSDKYLVIEGNRRICACKLIQEEHKTEIKKGLTHESIRGKKNIHYPLPDDLIKTIDNIDVLELDVKDVDPEEERKRERIILGVRHHGSLLEWDPLPKAYNLYQEYMAADPPLEEFTWTKTRDNKVRDVFTLGKQSPKRILRAYIAYRQLCEAEFSPQPGHFSLIQELVNNSKLSSPNGYFEIDGKTFLLSEDSLSKLDKLCEFDIRDGLDGKETAESFKILREPKSVKQLARLVDATKSHDSGLSRYASLLLQRVEDKEIPLEGIKDHPEQSATDALIEFENQLKWVDGLEKLLVKLDDEENLTLENFGSTNEIQGLDELDKQLEVFRRVFQIT